MNKEDYCKIMGVLIEIAKKLKVDPVDCIKMEERLLKDE